MGTRSFNGQRLGTAYRLGFGLLTLVNKLDSVVDAEKTAQDRVTAYSQRKETIGSIWAARRAGI